jgi:hypothetical protein
MHCSLVLNGDQWHGFCPAFLEGVEEKNNALVRQTAFIFKRFVFGFSSFTSGYWVNVWKLTGVSMSKNNQIEQAKEMLFWLLFPVDVEIVFKDKIEIAEPNKGMQKSLGCFTIPNQVCILKSIKEKEALIVFLHEMSHLYSYLESTPEFIGYDHTIPHHKRTEEKKAMKETELLCDLFRWWKESKIPNFIRKRKFAKVMDAWSRYRKLRIDNPFTTPMGFYNLDSLAPNQSFLQKTS